MRPDVNSWRFASQISAVEFSPRGLLYGRLLGWTIRLLLVHTILSLICFVAVRVLVFPDAGPEQSAPAATARRSAAAPTALPPAFSLEAARARLESPRMLYVVRDIVVAQLMSLVIVQLLFIPPIRRRLSGHVDGMKQLFNGIRDLASGNAPKPLPAGQGGELGYLCVAFNDMACRLLAGRKALLDAKENLEQRVEDRTRELREVAAQLDKMASTDPLTGLANRRRFTDDGQTLFEQSIKHETDLVCLLIDLDNFKSVNDALGHPVGDKVLCLASEILHSACRGNDLAARLGGDEFIVLMQMPDGEAGARIADRLIGQFQKRVAELLANKPPEIRPSMSAGVSTRITSGAATFDQLATAADQALYQAKAAGKSRSNLYVRELKAA